MILGDVEETVTTVEVDEETYEQIYKVKHISDPLCNAGISMDVRQVFIESCHVMV